MNLHTADVTARLKRFLTRRSVPKSLDGKPDAMADQVAALARLIQGYAPRDPEALSAWWPRFEALVGQEADLYWPTEKQIAVAAKALAPVSSVRPREEGDISCAEAAAKRMNAGEAVGEDWLYGRGACEMIEAKLVTREVMTAYRSGAYFRRKDMYGEEAALAWEADRKEMHARIWRDRQANSGKAEPEAVRAVMAGFGGRAA